MSRPPLSMSPVASALASITGSCSCGTTTVVTSRTRSVHAASAPSSVIASGLSNAIRSPQHSDENGPSSIALAQAFSVGASRSGSITGIVIPTRTTAILARPPAVGDRVWQHGAMAINTTSIAHIRLTVTDIARSRAFYESVFGWPINLEVPDGCRRRNAGTVRIPVRRRHLQRRRFARRPAARWPTTDSTRTAPASTTSRSGSPASPN